MSKSKTLLLSLLTALSALPPSPPPIVILTVVESFQWQDPFGAHTTPLGFEATCESKKTYRASQHLIADLEEQPPMGLAPWSDGIFYFFGGRPYPGTWDGVDNKGESREIMKMEYADVPRAVRAWIEEQKKGDSESVTKFKFAVFEKPKKEGDRIAGTAKPKKEGEEPVKDEDKVLMFAPGAIYDILPLWVADGSDCEGKFEFYDTCHLPLTSALSERANGTCTNIRHLI